MRVSRIFLIAVALAAGLVASARVQESSPSTAQSYSAQRPATGPVRYVEKEMWIPAPGAFPNGMDSLEVYIDRSGRHPLAVLTHGSAGNPEGRMHVTPWAQLSQAEWFAQRGYVAIVVVRRGYGRSGGQQDLTNGGCGFRGGSFAQTGAASAADLRAVMAFAQTLPQVDGNTMLSVGVSTGGFAQVALSANPPQGLKAAVSFAGGIGGDGHGHNCNLGDVIDAFGDFGKQAHKRGGLPMLWIYAENDQWFPPAMAQKFDAAYKKGGGVNQFVMAPPDGEDGHHLYSHVAAWSDTVTAFLKTQGLLPLGDFVLPAPVPPDVLMPAGLGDKDKEMWARFLLAPPFKSLAVDERGELSLFAAGFDQSLADSGAMEKCKKAHGESKHCSIVAKTPGMK